MAQNNLVHRTMLIVGNSSFTFKYSKVIQDREDTEKTNVELNSRMNGLREKTIRSQPEYQQRDDFLFG
jgi:hypothetical protein